MSRTNVSRVFIAVTVVFSITAIALLVQHTRTNSVPLLGKWTCTEPEPGLFQQMKHTFDFKPDGSGVSTLDHMGEHNVDVFHWHKDGAFINIVYSNETDREG